VCRFRCYVCCSDEDPEPCKFRSTKQMFADGSDPELCPVSGFNLAKWVLVEERDDGGK